MGSGVVFNVEAFFKELAELESNGVPRIRERIHVSSRCCLNFELHSMIGALREEELGINWWGATKRGIRPAYSCAVATENLRVIDVYHKSFEQKPRLLAEGYRKRYASLLQYSIEAELQRFKAYKDQLYLFIMDAVDYIKATQEKKRAILMENSQYVFQGFRSLSKMYMLPEHCSWITHTEHISSAPRASAQSGKFR